MRAKLYFSEIKITMCTNATYITSVKRSKVGKGKLNKSLTIKKIKGLNTIEFSAF